MLCCLGIILSTGIISSSTPPFYLPGLPLAQAGDDDDYRPDDDVVVISSDEDDELAGADVAVDDDEDDWEVYDTEEEERPAAKAKAARQPTRGARKAGGAAKPAARKAAGGGRGGGRRGRGSGGSSSTQTVSPVLITAKGCAMRGRHPPRRTPVSPTVHAQHAPLLRPAPRLPRPPRRPAAGGGALSLARMPTWRRSSSRRMRRGRGCTGWAPGTRSSGTSPACSSSPTTTTGGAAARGGQQGAQPVCWGCVLSSLA